MSSGSEPPYPPGPYPPGGQAAPAALPGRRARALPAGSAPSETEDDARGDTTMPQAAPDRQHGPADYQGGTRSGYAGPGPVSGGQEAGTWFNRSASGAPGGYSDGGLGRPGQQPGGQPGGPGGQAGYPQANGGAGLPPQQPGGYAGQQFSPGYPGQPVAGFTGQSRPGAQGPAGSPGFPASPGYGGSGQAGYQSATDLVIDVTGMTGTLTTADFV